MKIVLLPGLDGTGILFDPFIEHKAGQWEIRQYHLNHEDSLSYQEQVTKLLEFIGAEPCIIVAESYSGKIAFEAGLVEDSLIKHIVFVASFLEPPAILGRMVNYIPTTLFKNQLLLKHIVCRVVFRKWHTKRLQSLFISAINSVDAETLKFRLRQIASLSTPSQSLTIPCTYICASSDNLVPNSALNSFKKSCHSLKVVNLEGSHFLMQTNPLGVWKIINDIAI